jgi:Ca2+-binding RTX toxin-like protein
VIRVVADTTVHTFVATEVTRLLLVGSRTQFNDLSNATALPAKLVGGHAGNVLQGGTGADTLVTGVGRDLVYDVLGVNRLRSADGDGVRDALFTNAASTVSHDPRDAVVRFFGEGRTPGVGSIQFLAGVLYLTPPDGGSQTTLTQQGGSLTVTTSYANPLTVSGVRFVAYGGLGGDDTLVGSTGTLSFMKGGSGRDTLVVSPGLNTLRTDAVDFVVRASERDRVWNG